MKHAQDLRYTTCSVDLRLQRGASQPILANKRTKLAREKRCGPPDAKRAQDLCYTSCSVDLRLEHGASPLIHILHTHAKDDTLDHLT